MLRSDAQPSGSNFVFRLGLVLAGFICLSAAAQAQPGVGWTPGPPLPSRLPAQALVRAGAFVLAHNGESTLYNEKAGVAGAPFIPGVYKAFGFSADSRHFLYLKAKNKLPTFDLYCYDLRSGLEKKIAASVHQAVWSPAGQWFAYYWLDAANQAHISVFDLANESSVEVASGNLRIDSIDWSPLGLELLYIAADPAPAPVTADQRFINRLHRRFWRNGTGTVLPNIAAARFVAGELVTLGGNSASSAKALPNPLGEDIRKFVASRGRIYAEIVEAGRSVVKRWNPSSNRYDFVATGEILDSAESGVAVRSFTDGGVEYRFASNDTNLATTLLVESSDWKLPFSGWAYVVQGGELYQDRSCDGVQCFITAHRRQLGYALDWQQRPEENQGNTHILAVADGTVAATTNNMTCNTVTSSCSVGWDDYSTTCKDFTNGSGNYVAIAHIDGTYSFYAHLKSGSVQVAAGQVVGQGTYLADQGHSGVAGSYNNYLGCGDHLHFTRQIGPAVWDQSVPTDFTETPCTLGCPAAYQSSNIEIAPAPGLTSVSPANAVPGTTVQITLTGTNFLYGSTLSISGTGVSVSNVALVSATRITGSLSVSPGALPGAYNLTVTTSSGVSNPQSFTVSSSPDFALTPVPAAKSIPAGGTSTMTINVSSLGGFTGNVALSASGLPAGATASFAPASLQAGSSSIMTLNVGDAPTGSHTITVTGVSGAITRTATVSLTVPAGPDYSLIAGPSTQTLAAGGSVGYWVSLSALNGFSGSASLSVSGLPVGATAAFSPTSVAGGQTSALTVTASAGTLPGTYALTITGTNGTIVRSDSISVTVVSAGAGGTLGGTRASPASTQTLTTLGAYDWAHWGNGAAAIFNHKAGVAQQISDYTVLGLGAVSAYALNPVTFHWTDGAPTPSTSTATGVYITGLNKGFRITVPAGTSARTLHLFVGVWRAQGKLTAHLSDGSAADFVDTGINNNTGVSVGQYILTFRAGSDGQTLVVTYTQASDTTGNVTLQAAALTSGESTADFSVSVAPSSLSIAAGSGGAGSVTVVPINSFSGTVSLNVNGLPAGATANFAPATVPGGGVSNMAVTVGSGVALGTYPLTITGTSGNLSRTATVNLTVTPQGSGGTLSGELATPVGTQQLTLLGETDWTHWGLTSASSFNHRFGATEQIGNFSIVGNRTASQYGANPIGYSWTNGTPAASVTNTTTGVYVIGQNNGFRFSVPADTSLRLLRVYVGVWSAQGRFTASLSDGSAPDYVDTSVSNTTATSLGLYSLTYKASSPGQTLTITYTLESTPSQYGNVTLQAATLSPPATPDFALAPSPASQTIAPGGGTTYAVAVSAVNGFSGTTTFAIAGLPTGAAASFSPVSMPGGGTTTLAVSVGGTTPAGTYPLTITGTSGSLIHTASVTLIVSAPDFSLSASPSSQTVAPGGGTDYTVTVSAIGGFSGITTFAAAGLPSGATANFSPTSVSAAGSTTLTVSTLGTTPAGSYPLTITGTSGSLSHTASVTLVVSTPDFSLSASPASQTVAPGGGTTYAVSISEVNGFSGTTNFAIAGLPSGATGIFNPASVAGSGSTTLTVSTGTATAAGSYPLTITGTSGSLSHTAGVTLVILAPGGSTLAGSLATPSGTQQLTSLGTTDWAHWGLTSASSFNRKSGVPQQISNFSRVGTGPTQRFASSPVDCSWTDGTPTTSVSNTPAGVYVRGQNNGFRFSVPADTTLRTLSVLVGVWSAQGKMTAQLSDGSAPDYVDTSINNASATSLGVYTFNYRAASAGQTLTIAYTANSTASPYGNVTLQAATLSGPVIPDFSLSAMPPAQSVAVGAAANYTVTVSAVNGFGGVATFGVTGLPTGATASFSPVSVSGSGTTTLAVSVGGTTAAGTYPLTITATSGSLTRTAGITLTVTAPAGVGELSGSLAIPTGTQQLDALGTADWVHWGLTSASSFNFKSGVTRQISNFTRVGTGATQRSPNIPIGYSWTGGTPTATATNATTGVYVIGQGNGFRITAPADLTTRTLSVYVGVWSAQARMTAHLSDGSAVDYVDTSIDNGSATSLGVYTFTYRAATAGQALMITYTVNSTPSAWGNVTLQAATLQ